ncbi:unnamed protein product [Caenorhabditis angaria]|uniref:Serpentine receptor class gamma n=1 Tax=Caenorhabditis angaria TaxID=860376 RepID=A0A9P1MXE2_9PELO|nr:unnamed protein product [Caenorhabditis angaria]
MFLSVCFTIPTIYDNRKFYLENGDWVVKYLPETIRIERIMICVLIFIKEFIQFVFGTLTILRLRKSKIVSKDKKLVYVTLLHSLADLGVLIFEFTKIFNPEYSSNLTRNSGVFLIFILSSINCITIVPSNKTIWKNYKNTVLCRIYSGKVENLSANLNSDKH